MAVISEKTALPSNEYRLAWEAIKVEASVKERLVAQSLLSLQLRQNFTFEQMPIHGIILLAGPPGTGKTTLARGLANQVAKSLSGKPTQFVQIDAHALANASLGKSQQAVSKLFSETIPELAMQAPTIVLLDEVETLAADRQRMSLEANPVDVHRATDAALAGADHVARQCRNTLLIATTNYLEAVDSAFLSRADLIEDIGPPNEAAREAIIREMLDLFATRWKKIAQLNAHISEFVMASKGMDGRALRKAIISAPANSISTSTHPETLTAADVLSALQRAHKSNSKQLRAVA